MGPVALGLGVSARRGGAGGMATAGIVLGIIGSLMLLLQIILTIVMGTMGLFSPGGSNPFATP
jgi:hypothetical protein